MITFNRVRGDLFSVEQGHCLAHCISADFALGAGIAVEFDRRYNMRERLKKWKDVVTVGEAIKVDNVFNLITKSKAYEKPTYKDFKKAISNMFEEMSADHIKYLAIPKIGAGLDRLDWTMVLAILKDVANEYPDLNTQITIFYLEDDDDYNIDPNEIKGINESLIS